MVWDYLKGLDSLTITKVVNLASLCGFLVAHEDIPMHFFKVIDFADQKNLSKPTVMFLHLMLQAVFDQLEDTEKLKIVFVKALKEDDNGKNRTFVNGLTEFILGKFYKRVRKQQEAMKLPKAMQVKIKAIFNVINNLQQQAAESFNL